MEQIDAMGIEAGTHIRIIFDDSKDSHKPHISTKEGTFKGLTGNLLVFINQNNKVESINIDRILRTEEVEK